ncbi:MAG: sensor histidine kinase, partial [Nevskiales bacterium]
GGLLGSLIFLASLAANALAQRAKTSEELAARSHLDLANLAQLNEAIISRMGMGVLVVDSTQRIRLLNRGAARLLGVSQSLTGGKLDQLAPALAARVQANLGQLAAEADAVQIEIGEQRLLCHLVPLKEFVPPALMVYLEDAARVDEQAQQIKLAALGRLTASIAHEIRNPLGAISHAEQLLSDWESSTEERLRLLDIIRRHSSRINQIVEDVMHLSRRENFTPQTLQLREQLERIAGDFREEYEGRDIRFTFDEVPDALEVRADPQHLRQILHNLWDNSVQHSGQPKIEIRHRGGWRNPSGRPFLEVRDNGPGVQPGITDKIFEPFFTTASHGGVGLGLYIVRELCECNRARINWQSRAAGGACFRLTFAAMNEWVA